MSYARLSANSDVYVFCSNLGLECCGCSLIPHHWEAVPGTFLGGYFRQDNPEDTEVFGSNAEMIAHLERHIEAGHLVPEYALERLRDPSDVQENERIWAEE